MDFLGEIQGDFRRGRCTEDNLFMLERLIEMGEMKEGGDSCDVSGYGEAYD